MSPTPPNAPVGDVDLAQAMVPKRHYDIPEFLVQADSPEIGWQSDAQQAMAQVTALAMQSYALAWLEMFDEYPQLEAIEISVSKDGFIMLTNVDGVEETVLEGDMEGINDRRDRSILPFINCLCEEHHLVRADLQSAIARAYDAQANLLGVACWKEISDKRQAVLEGSRLEQQTPPAPSPKHAAPRL